MPPAAAPNSHASGPLLSKHPGLQWSGAGLRPLPPRASRPYLCASPEPLQFHQRPDDSLGYPLQMTSVIHVEQDSQTSGKKKPDRAWQSAWLPEAPPSLQVQDTHHFAGEVSVCKASPRLPEWMVLPPHPLRPEGH